ncbi:SusD family protein [bacterium A37T11]|nr:SusD family protein [bacterium A37T11]
MKFIVNYSLLKNKCRLLGLFSYSVLGICLSGCKKFADVPPPNDKLTSATVFTTDNSVNSALSGMYYTLYGSDNTTFQLNLSVCPENSADETQYYTQNDTYDPFFYNSLNVNNNTVYAIWTHLYGILYQANAIIKGVEENTSLISAGMQKKAIGEAKFIRAFCLFYLTNFFGDIPLVITPDAVSNTNLARSDTSKVFDQIITDLAAAKAQLLTDYSSSTSGSRIRPIKYAAGALLARAYLYRKNWPRAEAEADSVINAAGLYSLLSTSELSHTFLLDSKEAIFQMNMPAGSAYCGYTQYAWNYIYNNEKNFTPWMALTTSLVKAFEPGDKRFSNWVRSLNFQDSTYYYPYKYRNLEITTDNSAEAYTYLRLAEQYLIRAEARARQNNLLGAKEDINVIRNRAGLGDTKASTQGELLLAIEQERRIELFCEMGHRWHDLKRTGRIDEVLGAAKTGWRSTAALYPIPLLERNNDVNLTQNEGY